MKSVQVLIKSLVFTFYKANIGFFGVVLYLAFFLMRGQDHITLATSIATSFSLTLLTLVLWTAYWIKAMGFVYKTINTGTYLFLRQLPLYSTKKQFILLFVVLYFIGEPAWAYAIFISFFNLKYESYGLLMLMISFLLISNSSITLVVMYLLKHPIREKSFGLWHKVISKKFSLPYSFWYVRHLFIYEFSLIFLTKTGSLLLLLGTYRLFETDTYDWRLLAVGSLFGFSINSMLVYHNYEFNMKNYWIYNVPRKPIRIILSTFLTSFILFIPESIFILFHYTQSIVFMDWVNLIIFQTVLSYFLSASLLIKPISTQAYGGRIFYLIIVMILTIMYSLPMLIVNLVLLSFGLWVLSNYYKYNVNTIP